MSKGFHIIIPARYQSTRFPGKLLQQLGGQTVIERVYQQALKAKPKSIIIATDHQEIFTHAKAMGAEVMMTASEHQSGTDRIAEVVAKQGYAPEDVIVNVQGDEPLIAPELVMQVAELMLNTSSPVSTLCWPIEKSKQFSDPNVVKVVRDQNDNALYFSRSPIPLNRHDASDCSQAYRHIGLYAYRAKFLLDIVSWPVCSLESLEGLEQLRVLWSGNTIKVAVACKEPLQDINTEEDLARAQALF